MPYVDWKFDWHIAVMHLDPNSKIGISDSLIERLWCKYSLV